MRKPLHVHGSELEVHSCQHLPYAPQKLSARLLLTTGQRSSYRTHQRRSIGSHSLNSLMTCSDKSATAGPCWRSTATWMVRNGMALAVPGACVLSRRGISYRCVA